MLNQQHFSAPRVSFAVRFVILTWYFKVDTDAPISSALGAEDVQVTKPDLPHAVFNLSRAFIPSYSNLFTVARVRRVVKSIDEVMMRISHWAGDVSRFVRLLLKGVEQLVVMLVLCLQGRSTYRI